MRIVDAPPECTVLKTGQKLVAKRSTRSDERSLSPLPSCSKYIVSYVLPVAFVTLVLFALQQFSSAGAFRSNGENCLFAGKAVSNGQAFEAEAVPGLPAQLTPPQLPFVSVLTPMTVRTAVVLNAQINVLRREVHRAYGPHATPVASSPTLFFLGVLLRP